LLFGILALQMDFLGRDDLIAALHAWVLEKSKSLGQILLDQGKLSPPRLQLLDALVSEHLQAHQDDPQQSLAALSSASPVWQALRQITDVDVRASLTYVSAAAEATAKRTASLYPAPAAGLHYRILRPHARGGLGEVFVAEDTELQREVALKEIRKEHAGNAASRSRFVLEAKITGGLEHPGIVPIYGLGQYEDGRPFYAMRFIKGDNLKEAIQDFHEKNPPRDAGERNVAFRELLGRFVDVCNAVAYAHSRGVLHRDLKPGNVMLGKYGETLVVDWGLAKPVGRAEGLPDSREATLRLSSADCDLPATQMGSAVGTPAFMSPEQAAGRLDQLGPAADIYSLGATLYALLTGKVPFEGGLAEVLRQVQCGEFPAPRQVKAEVPVALEAICLKAMALQTDQRYRTALALAEDVEHWLADEPVSAWPEPVTVRLGRWALRHRPLVTGAAAALLVGLFALAAGAFWYQQDQAARYADGLLQKQQAQEELGRAALLRGTLQETLARAGGIRKLLDEPASWQAQLREAGLHRDNAQALLARLGAASDPELEEQLQLLTRQLQQDEDDRQLAMELEEIRFQRFVLVRNEHDFAAPTRAYPKVFGRIGLNVLSGDVTATAAQIRASVLKEQLVAALDDWAVLAWHLKRSKEQMHLLQLARLADPSPWGDRLRDEAIWRDRTIAQRLTDELLADTKAWTKQSPQMLALVGEGLNSIGGDARSWLRQAQARHPRDFWLTAQLADLLLQDKSPEAVGFYRVALAVRPENVLVWNNLGVVLRDQKDLKGAENAFRQALHLNRRHALIWSNLGGTLNGQNRPREAVEACQQALAIDPQFAPAWSNLGNALVQLKDHKGAADAYRQDLKIEPNYVPALVDLSAVLVEQKDFSGAAAACRQALALKPQDAMAWFNLGNVLKAQNDPKGAANAYDKALKINPRFLKAWNNLAGVLLTQNDPRGAEDACRKALQIDAKTLRPWNSLGNALLTQTKFQEAAEAYQKAVQIDPQFSEGWSNLGAARFRQGNSPAAVAAFRKALKIDPHFGEAWYNLGLVLEEQRDWKAAIEAYDKALAIDPQFAKAWRHLGDAWRAEKDWPRARAAYQKAVDIDARDAQAWAHLGFVLQTQRALPESARALRKAAELNPNFGATLLAQGEFRLAQLATERALQLLPADSPMRATVERQIPLCQRALQLDQRTQAVLRGKAVANGVEELLNLAKFCRQYHRYYSAFRLFITAFAVKPNLTAKLDHRYRWHAAGAAARVAAGQGFLIPKLTDANKAALRRKALNWLRDDLKLCTQAVQRYQKGNQESARPEPNLPTKLVGLSSQPALLDWLQAWDRLSGWRIDSAFAGLREEQELAKLPPTEQAEWRQFWADVRTLEKQARTCFTEQRHKGSLTAQRKEQVHEVLMQAGKTYVFDLESTAFDTFLRLEDAKGQKMAENNDIESGVCQNSRIVFPATTDGAYRLVATAFQGQGMGAYVLRIREFTIKK
jgi:tetratricopeptide (TPR) repeat protein/tRNA A-37 threonylcarbamoyl transferase component Bud32